MTLSHSVTYSTLPLPLFPLTHSNYPLHSFLLHKTSFSPFSRSISLSFIYLSHNTGCIDLILSIFSLLHSVTFLSLFRSLSLLNPASLFHFLTPLLAISSTLTPSSISLTPLSLSFISLKLLSLFPITLLFPSQYNVCLPLLLLISLSHTHFLSLISISENPSSIFLFHSLFIFSLILLIFSLSHTLTHSLTNYALLFVSKTLSFIFISLTPSFFLSFLSHSNSHSLFFLFGTPFPSLSFLSHAFYFSLSHALSLYVSRSLSLCIYIYVSVCMLHSD